MKEITKKAIEKVKQELNEYRKEQVSKSAEEVYSHTTRHMFVEATAHYSIDLIEKSEEIAKLILIEEANTIDCAEAVMIVAQKVGNLASMTIDHFYNSIWDYYRIDHMLVKKLKQIEEIKSKSKTKKKIITNPKNNNDKQLSLF